MFSTSEIWFMILFFSLRFNGIRVFDTQAGGLLDELRHLWNLDFVEKTCDFVYKNLSTMQKIA